MKIIKFNENQSNDKFVKITFGGERTVPMKDVENTSAYQRYMNEKKRL